MSGTLLIDANAIGYSEHNATKLSSGGMQTQAIFGFTKKVSAFKEQFPDYRHLVLWDGKAQWRYDLYPGYKGNRESDQKKKESREAYKVQRPHIARILNALGIDQIRAHRDEADDLAGSFARDLTRKPDHKVVLVTGDGDWLQLVQPNVDWYDPRKDGKWVTHKDFTDKTGYLGARQFLEGKALQGDISDTINGVGGLGEKYAAELIAEHGSVEEFLKKVDAGYMPRLKREQNLASPEGREIFRRNMRLMNLIDAPKPNREDITIVRGRYDEAAFKELCARYAFHSILRGFDRFIQPFTKEQKWPQVA